LPLARAQGYDEDEAKAASKAWAMGGGGRGGGIPDTLQAQGPAGIAADTEVAKLKKGTAEWEQKRLEAKQNMLTEVAQYDFNDPKNYPMLAAIQQKYTPYDIDVIPGAFKGNVPGAANYIVDRFKGYREKLRAEGQDIQFLGRISDEGKWEYQLIPKDAIPSFDIQDKVANDLVDRLQKLNKAGILSDAITGTTSAAVLANRDSHNWKGQQEITNQISSLFNAQERANVAGASQKMVDEDRDRAARDKILADARRSFDTEMGRMRQSAGSAFADYEMLLKPANNAARKAVEKDPERKSRAEAINRFNSQMLNTFAIMATQSPEEAQKTYANAMRLYRPDFLNPQPVLPPVTAAQY
jgi:hypothetical protein